jgi:hypothetical protein
MSSTININDLTLAHKGSGGTASATIPDVCKTPSPGGPVPLPYPNVAISSDLSKGTKTVKVDGGKMAANKGSKLARSTGDEPGVTGGVKSSTFIKEATWLLYSFDVMLEGKNACRLSDKLFMNHQNTVCLQGWIQNYLTGKNKKKTHADACKAMGPYIDDVIGEGQTGEGTSYRGRGLEERMRQNTTGGSLGVAGAPTAPIDGLAMLPNYPEGTNSWQRHDEEIRKQQNLLGDLLDEYDEECKDYVGRKEFKERMERGRDMQLRPRPTPADWNPT